MSDSSLSDNFPLYYVTSYNNNVRIKKEDEEEEKETIKSRNQSSISFTEIVNQ